MKSYIIANWKMNPPSLSHAYKLWEGYKLSSLPTSVEVVICPPDIFLPSLINEFKSECSWGGQNCFWETSGAYTGEISPQQLRTLGAQYVILGHSERREHLGETDEMINKKFRAALAARLKPILCVGGGREAKSPGADSRAIARRQLTKALKAVTPSAIRRERLLIAYEPPWALSTISGGRPAPVEYAVAVARSIREWLVKKYASAGKAIPVLYGGSINSQTAGNFRKQKEFSGFLVGGASLKPIEFRKILES